MKSWFDFSISDFRTSGRKIQKIVKKKIEFLYGEFSNGCSYEMKFTIKVCIKIKRLYFFNVY